MLQAVTSNQAAHLLDGRQPLDADTTRTDLDPPIQRACYAVAGLLGLVAYAAYLSYRGLYTINTDALVFSLLVYCAEVHGFLALAFYIFQVWRPTGRTVPEPAEGLTVDVFIPTYNEDPALLRQTIRRALAMRYPHTTYILDDGRRPAVRALAKELGCRYITRDTNRDAKAGNWNNAFAQTSGDVIATFDADHIPQSNFLERTLGFFRDPKVAIVQVPQQYHNLDSIQHRVNWNTRRRYGEQDVFFNLVMAGKDRLNACFFCGTGAVLHRAALAPHGGLLGGTLTEDMHTSMVLHARGWKSVYLNETLATGLAPEDFASFHSQRLRWAEGNLQILKFINPLTCRGLTLAQRICYLASMYHWTTGIPKLIFYIAPPWILFTGTFPIANFTPTFLGIYVLFLGTLVLTYKVVSRGSGRLLMEEFFNMASCFALIRAVTRFVVSRIVGRKKPGTFIVTTKGGGGGRQRKHPHLLHVLPHWGLLAFNLLALPWSWWGLSFGVTGTTWSVVLCSFWTLYTTCLIGGVIALFQRPRQKRRSTRFRVEFPVEDASYNPQTGGLRPLGVATALSETGCTLRWPTVVPTGARRSLKLHVGVMPVQCRGEIVAVRSDRAGGWAVHGVRFVDLDRQTIDILNDAVVEEVVPELFDRLSRPSLARQLSDHVKRRLGARFVSRARRRDEVIPARITTPTGGFVVATRDLSADGLALRCPRPMSIGATVLLTTLGPRDQESITGEVVRCAPVTGLRAPVRAWIVGIRVLAKGPAIAVQPETDKAA